MVTMWEGRASAGDAAAQFQLGACLEMGVGVPVDMAAACVWYRRAAAQGHPRAQYHLGLAYSYGAPGVPWDLAEACKWLTLASRGGIREAAEALKQMRMPHEQRELGESMATEFAAKAEPQGPVVDAGADREPPVPRSSAEQRGLDL
jgi:TPR repeat protein